MANLSIHDLEPFLYLVIFMAGMIVGAWLRRMVEAAGDAG